MATSPFAVDTFGGINLVDDPEEVGISGCVDLLNVDFDQPGRVRTRDGWSLVGTGAATSDLQALAFYRDASSIDWLVASDSTTLRPYHGSTFAAGTTQAGSATSNNSFARFGDTTNTVLYVAASAYYKWDGTAWTSVGGAPANASILAVTPNDNRMALATGALDAKIYFSDPGAPETFGANNFVTLLPGDGEPITGLVRWRNQLFAFKRSKFAVFSNTSTDTDGQPIFNYYTVDSGRGVGIQGGAVAGDDGVFFADISGIYVTTGGAPTYISRPLEPWFNLASTPLPSPTGGLARLTYHNRRLYVNFPEGSVMAVFDTVTQKWTVWSLAATALLGVSGLTTGYQPGLYLGDPTTNKIGFFSSASNTDNGSSITWRYTSGLYDLGEPGQVKVTLESAMWGTGQVTLQVANDHGSVDTGSLVTLGSSPAVAEGWQQVDREGVFFQHKLSGTTAASVSRLVHYVSFIKPAGIA